jgi:hypothetical protein
MTRFTLVQATAVMILLAAVSGGRVAAADDAAPFDYDIFRQGDTLAVWLDLTPIMNQRRMEDLLAGLAVRITVDLRLEKPRWPLTARTLASARSVVTLARRLTEDAYYVQVAGLSTAQYKFNNQLELSDCLADSLVFPVTEASVSPPGERIRLTLNIACNSLNPNVLYGTSASTTASEGNAGIFDRLFTLFNETIGLGADSYRLVSPLFDPAALPAPR